MRIHASNPESGEAFSGVADGLDEATINGFFNTFDVSDEGLRKWIGGLPFSAEAKAILYKIASTTIRAGEFVIKIGRKILEIIWSIVRKFPNATLGLIIGAVLGSLITSIPIIGFAIGPFVTALAMVIGAAWGAYKDIQGALNREMQESLSHFEVLRTA